MESLESLKTLKLFSSMDYYLMGESNWSGDYISVFLRAFICSIFPNYYLETDESDSRFSKFDDKNLPEGQP